MSAPNNSRGLVRSMLVIGSAQSISIVISIVRMKLLAVMLGPAGIGLLSLYQNLQQMAVGVAGLGLGSSGVRQLAAARGEDAILSRVRRVLLLANAVQGTIAMVIVWLFREPLAVWLLDDAQRAREVGLVGVAVLLSLLAASQTALLQGLRRIGDLGRVTVLGALAGTIVGLFAVWLLGQEGLIWLVLAQPLALVGVALFYVRRLPRPANVPLPMAEIWVHWKPMAELGAVFMLGGLATTATLLFVRSRITHEMGLDAAGQFAAAWGITMTYVGFLLSAMSADYFPRLTEMISDKAAATQLMNDQAQLGLAIGGPVLLLLIGLAPWAITLLYSAEFEDAVTLLQWQTVGNVFKLASWALSFSIVAAARSGTFLMMEQSFNVVYLVAILALLPVIGLPITGMAFVAGYAVYLATVYILARRLVGFHWQKMSLQLLSLHTLLAGGLLLLALSGPPLLAAMLSIVLAGATGLIGLRIVLRKIGPSGRYTAPLASAYAAIGWPVREVT